jgi:hypothetical protein
MTLAAPNARGTSVSLKGIEGEIHRSVRCSVVSGRTHPLTAQDAREKREGNVRRRRQAETIAAIITERPPPGPYVVLGDLNDTPGRQSP